MGAWDVSDYLGSALGSLVEEDWCALNGVEFQFRLEAPLRVAFYLDLAAADQERARQAKLVAVDPGSRRLVVQLPAGRLLTGQVFAHQARSGAVLSLVAVAVASYRAVVKPSLLRGELVAIKGRR